MKNLALFYGGYSSEFEISKLSAHNIYRALPKRFNTYLTEVRQEGWFVIDGEDRQPVDLNDLTFPTKNGRKNIDVGLVYIHGDPGENGKIQAFMEMKGLPCINSSTLAAELSFDKWYCNSFLKNFGVLVAESIRLRKGEPVNAEEIIETLGLPLFVKPTDSGSSFGVSKVKQAADLQKAIDFAFEEGDMVIMESFLNGREVTCGVYRNVNGVVPLPLTEIISEGEFFDYEAKYEGHSQEITPADLSENIVREIQATTVKIYDLLNLRSVARVDFMLVGNTPYVIEVNAIPGFSKASLVPQQIEAHGISVEQFWTEILDAEFPQS